MDDDAKTHLVPWRSLKVRVTGFTLVIFVLGIWTLSLFVSRSLQADMEHLLGDQQFSVVAATAKEINGNLNDRLKALKTVADDMDEGLIRNPAALQTRLEQRPLLQLLFNGGVWVAGLDGTAIADVPLLTHRIGTNHMDVDFIATALKEGKSAVSVPVMDKQLNAPIFAMTMPLRDAQGKVLGVVVGVTNLGKPSFLDKISKNGYGETGGYVLADANSRLFIAGTDSSRILKKFPPIGVSPELDRFFNGFEGTQIYVNPVGVKVMASVKGIPAGGWLLGANMPTAEAFAPLVHRQQRLVWATSLLTVLVGVLTWLVLKRQLAPLEATADAMTALANSKEMPQPLPGAQQGEIGRLVAGFNRILEHSIARERELTASKQFKDTVLDSLNAEIAVIDHKGIIQAINKRWGQFSLENSLEPGKPAPRTGVGTNYLDACRVDLDSDGASEAYAGIQSVLEGRSSIFNLEYPCDLPTKQRWFSMTVMRLGQEGNHGAVITHTNITERKLSEAKLQLAANVFEHAREAIIVTDSNVTIVDVNAAFTRITGYSREEAIGQNPRMLSSGRHDKSLYESMWAALNVQGHWSGEIWNRRKNGEIYAELLTISAVTSGNGTALQYVALFSDITAIKDHQRELEHIAHFDALTNLPSRLLLADRLKQAMSQVIRRNQKVAVAYLDLDGFKAVNDNHGHDVGDKLLIHLATGMKEALREGDTLARLGGDEFVAVLLDLDGVDNCLPLLARLLEAAAAPMQLDDAVLRCSASIGVAFYPQAQEIEPDQLLRQADQAMYQAKLAGKNRYQIFDTEHDNNLRSQHETVERIRQAMGQGEFVLHYQPKVNMRSGQVIGSEALIRWQHPERGLLAPSTFLPVIEDHPLAVELGEWVIDTALTQLERWHEAGLEMTVSVNIGARQLQQGDFLARLQTILEKHPKVNPNCLQLEVLETSALADIEQVSRVIEYCASIGVKFALDDFGTGYSSLTYLKRLRVAMLKIDQSFVRDMLDDQDDLAILEGVIGLAAAFKREVIAEGVETVAHGAALLHLGCELAQGYGIARPMPAEQMPAWVATWRPDAAWLQSNQNTTALQ